MSLNILCFIPLTEIFMNFYVYPTKMYIPTSFGGNFTAGTFLST